MRFFLAPLGGKRVNSGTGHEMVTFCQQLYRWFWFLFLRADRSYGLEPRGGSPRKGATYSANCFWVLLVSTNSPSMRPAFPPVPSPYPSRLSLNLTQGVATWRHPGAVTRKLGPGGFVWLSWHTKQSVVKRFALLLIRTEALLGVLHGL